MSAFNYSNLAGLFGGQNPFGSGGHNRFAGFSQMFGGGGGGAMYGGSQMGHNPSLTGYFNPATGNPAYAPSASFGGGGFNPYGSIASMNPQRVQQVGSGGQGGPTYGQMMQYGLMQDFGAAEQARQQELGLYGGLFGNLQRGLAQNQAMLGSVGSGINQYRGDLDRSADAMRGMFQAGQADYDKAMGMIAKAPGAAGSYYGKAIKTMEDAIAEHKFDRNDTIAANVLGLQNQYQNQMNAITSNSSLTDEQRSMMQDELRMNMQQNTAGLVSQADQAAAESLLGAKNALAQLQGAAGSTIGGLQAQAGAAMGSLAMARTGMGVEMESNIGNLYSSMNQFSMSILQSATASAFQNQLQGNMAMASIIQQAPLGPVSFAEMLARMTQASDARPGDMISPYLANLLGIA